MDASLKKLYSKLKEWVVVVLVCVTIIVVEALL